MNQENTNLLLITEDIAIKQQIGVFSESCEEGTCKVLTEKDLLNNVADIILIAEDKIGLLLNEKIELPECPIIYLHKENSDADYITLIKLHVDEILDMNKITAIGFFRTISSILEKFFIQRELKNQKNILKKLIGSTSNTASSKKNITADESTVTTKNLIEENKRLIAAIQEQNEALKKVARVDLLTKVGNRLSFDETFSKMIDHAKRHKHLLAMLMLDLDKFKDVNDTYGHQMGDLLLQAAADRFQNCLRKGDFIARMGGDEFAIILNEIKSPHAAGLVSWKILQEICKPFYLNNIEIRVDASIGIACFTVAGNTFEELVRNADIAMYQAKKSHTLKYAFANTSIQDDHAKRIKIENELKTAVDRDELEMVYQPIYEIPSRQLHGFEALIRWKNKNLGQISPAEFIPIAEDSGLIHPISKWVFNTVCKQISLWKGTEDFPYKICINLSPSQLIEPNLLSVIKEVIEKYNVSLSTIEFEITEMAAMQENEAVTAAIKGLCELGASHALDDFGTGYSSMKHLRLLPISTIKIDLSFVQGLGINKTDDSIVSSIIALAKKMGLKVVAEGVETQQQLDALLAEGCDFIQGYFFSKPISSAQALELMNAKK